MNARAWPTVRLLGSLLPATWPDRALLLATAERVDQARGGDGSGDLMRAWTAWRCTGELPNDALLRDLLAAIGLLLGGLRSEMRYRPRAAPEASAGAAPLSSIAPARSRGTCSPRASAGRALLRRSDRVVDSAAASIPCST